MDTAIEDKGCHADGRRHRADKPRFQRIVLDTKRRIRDGSLAEHAAPPSERRIADDNGHPIFVETEFVNARRCPGFLENDLPQFTTRLLEARHDLCAHTGDIAILMRPATKEETGLLGLAPNSAGMELTQTIRDSAGRAFCFGLQFWRGEAARVSARAIVGGTGHD